MTFRALRPSVKVTGIIVVALIVIYVIAGFFVIPPLVRPEIVATLAKATGQPVSLGDLDLNPLTLSATLEDFRLLDKDSVPLITFRRLYLNYELGSLFQNAHVLSAFHLDTPYVAVRVMQNRHSAEEVSALAREPDEHAVAVHRW